MNAGLQRLLDREMTRKQFLGLGALAVASLFGLGGVIKMLSSHAATPFVTSEPENGTSTVGATFVTDTAASGGKAVKFSAPAAAPPPPPPSASVIWEPTDLARTNWNRPSGAGYITWESLVGQNAAAAQAATPNKPVDLGQAIVNKVTGQQILTLPTGIFETPNGFPGSNNASLALGTGSGAANSCRGIAGSGPGGIAYSGKETIIRMKGTTTTNFNTLIRFNNVPNAYLGGLSLRSNQVHGDGMYGTGVFIAYSNNVVFEHLYTRGISPGYANYPPGETFGINVFHSPDFTIRDSELDGRDQAGNRTCASPLGWNSVINGTAVVNVQRVYAHHGLASMLTFWQTTNISTEDYYTYAWPSSSGMLSGHGINHEQSGGRIRHVRPRLFMNGSKSTGPTVGEYGHPAADTAGLTTNSGANFSLQTGLSDAGADFIMWYPQWDNTLGTSGLICMASYNGYSLGQSVRTAPKIYLKDSSGADYLLGIVNHPTSGWNTADPLRYYAWLH